MEWWSDGVRTLVREKNKSDNVKRRCSMKIYCMIFCLVTAMATISDGSEVYTNTTTQADQKTEHLMEKYIGKEVTLIERNEYKGWREEKPAILVSYSWRDPIFKINDRIRMGNTSLLVKIRLTIHPKTKRLNYAAGTRLT